MTQTTDGASEVPALNEKYALNNSQTTELRQGWNAAIEAALKIVEATPGLHASLAADKIRKLRRGDA